MTNSTEYHAGPKDHAGGVMNPEFEYAIPYNFSLVNNPTSNAETSPSVEDHTFTDSGYQQGTLHRSEGNFAIESVPGSDVPRRGSSDGTSSDPHPRGLAMVELDSQVCYLCPSQTHELYLLTESHAFEITAPSCSLVVAWQPLMTSHCEF